MAASRQATIVFSSISQRLSEDGQAGLGAVGRDGGLADKAGSFVDSQARGCDVSLEIGTGFQGAALACEDVALDRSLNGDEARFDVASHFAAGANGQRPGGCDRSVDFSFND